MDFKISRKERRIFSTGPVEILMDNVFDLYPVLGNDPKYDGQDIYIGQDTVSGQDRENVIMDVETLDDDRAELLDRSMWAVVKQRGGDPVELEDGIQWAEAILEEVPAPVVVQQIHRSVAEEGPGVRVVPSVTKCGMRETLNFTVELTSAI